MASPGVLIGITLSTVILTAPRLAAAQNAPETPEQVSTRYVRAMTTGDWNGMASLMHPTALHKLRDMLAPLFTSDSVQAWRESLLGVRSVADAKAMSDTAVFAALVGRAMEGQASIKDMLANSHVDIIGHVAEGQDTVHVVYRLVMAGGNVTASKMDVFSLQRWGKSWRGLLSGDITILAAAVRRAAGL